MENFQTLYDNEKDTYYKTFGSCPIGRPAPQEDFNRKSLKLYCQLVQGGERTSTVYMVHPLMPTELEEREPTGNL